MTQRLGTTGWLETTRRWKRLATRDDMMTWMRGPFGIELGTTPSGTGTQRLGVGTTFTSA
jgi:hypothetical protein